MVGIAHPPIIHYSELWEDDFSTLLRIVKDFIADVCESRLYVDDT